MDKPITLSALLDLLKPTERLFITHRLGPHECEAVGEGTIEELRAARCVEACGDNAVERISASVEGYPWEQDPIILVTIGGKAARK